MKLHNLDSMLLINPVRTMGNTGRNQSIGFHLQLIIQIFEVINIGIVVKSLVTTPDQDR